MTFSVSLSRKRKLLDADKEQKVYWSLCKHRVFVLILFSIFCDIESLSRAPNSCAEVKRALTGDTKEKLKSLVRPSRDAARRAQSYVKFCVDKFNIA